MRKILSEMNIGKYKVLKLDGETPKTKYSKYVIGGKPFTIVPINDAPNCVAVESADTLVGLVVEFV